MKQPDLGKKIAELRKAKCLTQEELVKKCNLNVRTLQRIESGLVTPRGYTIKTIFAVLECNIPASLENMPYKCIKTGFAITHWLEQLYRYVVDLFNLKTNTMRKISVLSALCTILIISFFCMCMESNAHKPVDSKYSKTNGRGIVYLFPRGLAMQISNTKDTADYKIGHDLLQEFKQILFLNYKQVGFAHLGDTVVLDKGRIEIRRPDFWEFRSSNGKGIVFVIPKELAMNSYAARRDSDIMNLGSDQIVEYNNKIFLNEKYCGIANAGDSVIFKKGTFFSKSAVSIKKGF